MNYFIVALIIIATIAAFVLFNIGVNALANKFIGKDHIQRRNESRRLIEREGGWWV